MRNRKNTVKGNGSTMPKEVQPKDTSRAKAYELWMKAPNPMVTFFKTLDVTNLLKVSRRKNRKFNMLLCFCILRAAVNVREFYILPVGEKLMRYDSLAVSTIIKNRAGDISYCDISYSEDLDDFASVTQKAPHGSLSIVRTRTCRLSAWL